jgi:predicted lipid-binding transport protein (Tim44 family)
MADERADCGAQPDKRRYQEIMGGSFQFIDIIVFAVIAVFLVLRLRSVLGRRTGTEQRRDPFAGAPANDQPVRRDGPAAVPDLSAKPAIAAPGTPADKAPETPLTKGLAAIHEADPSFDDAHFLAGCRAAFEMIVNAFAAGDSAALRPLLSDDVFANFNGAIEERRKAGHMHTTTVVGIRSVDLLEAELQNRNAVLTAKIVSEQINVTRDSAGRVVDGDAAAVVPVTDIWTFSRNTRSRDPNWTLVATRSPT